MDLIMLWANGLILFYNILGVSNIPKTCNAEVPAPALQNCSLRHSSDTCRILQSLEP